MPYFPAGGGVGYRSPTTQFWSAPASAPRYHQPARGTRARFGQSLTDILGTISNVAGDIGQGVSGGGAGIGANYYTAGGPYSPPPPAPMSIASGLSSTTLLLGAALIGGLVYFGTKKH